MSFRRVNSLTDHDYGFVFVRKGLFIERTNGGFCGTLPITYGEFEGNWERHGDIHTINTRYYAGSQQYIWKIKYCDQSSLSIVVVQ